MSSTVTALVYTARTLFRVGTVMAVLTPFFKRWYAWRYAIPFWTPFIGNVKDELSDRTQLELFVTGFISHGNWHRNEANFFRFFHHLPENCNVPYQFCLALLKSWLQLFVSSPGCLHLLILIVYVTLTITKSFVGIADAKGMRAVLHSVGAFQHWCRCAGTRTTLHGHIDIS